MNFKAFRDALTQHFADMSKSKLFVVATDSKEIWDTYLGAFPNGSNPIYRTNTEHDCSICRHFVRTVGGVVTIKDGKITTVWDFVAPDNAYRTVADKMSAYVRSKPIAGIFLSKEAACGALITYGDDMKQYTHFRVAFPSQAVVGKHGDSIDTLRGDYRTSAEVFFRSLTAITADSIEAALELISQNTLYRGEGWKLPLQEFLQYKKDFLKLPNDQARHLFAWEKQESAGAAISRIRNQSIGVLLTDISEGMDLEQAVRRYESAVAPSNYKRPKAVFTQKMLEQAQSEITKLGYIESIGRRHANLNDIAVNNILFCNRDATTRIKGGDIFSELKKEAKATPLKLGTVEEIPVERFVNDVLPLARELEAQVEAGHAKNMVSLIAPAVHNAKTMFKWNNGFSWTYAGNVTDSMKERVKAAGGNVTGELRFSIQWNDVESNKDDLDAHCQDAAGVKIYFGNKRSHRTSGVLDVDIIHPQDGVPAVENITWASRNTMVPGKYTFYVNQYSNRGGRGGFSAEIEFDGKTYHYSSDGRFEADRNIPVANVLMDSNKNFTIEHLMPTNVSSKTTWGIKTNVFIPVSVVMFSPDYWDGQRGNGNRHYFFMLKDCVNPDEPNGFYNEFLKPELEKYRHVFEALGSKARVAKTEDQLSGVGFSSTRRDSLVVKVKGQTERILRIMF